MQALNLQHWMAVITATVVRTLCLVIPILSALLCGCATAEKSYHFSSNSVTKVSYDPKHCTEQPDGRFKCKEVILTVSGIQPEK